MENRIICPLVDGFIDVVDCMENRDTREQNIPGKYKIKKDWKEICKNCEYQDF